MCSINGVFSSSQISDSDIEWSRKTQQQLIYRGPDESREFSDNHCILSTNRFNITGIENGQMPITNDDKTIQVIFNGEIYNYKELKKELETKGYIFHTLSDTEVILNTYTEYGTNCFEKFIGMFAIAIYDQREPDPLFILARDRVGEKPLFYLNINSKLYFASEQNNLISLTNKNIDKQAVAQFLTLNSPVDSLIQGIKRLRPGNFLCLSDNEIKITPYWSPNFLTNYSISFDQAVDSYQNILEEVIEMLLPQEVKFGSFISGGVDSALISCLVKNALAKNNRTTEKNLNLISSGLVDVGKDIQKKYIDSDYNDIEKTINELEFTKILAEHFNTTSYYERNFNIKDLEQDFGDMVSHLPGGPVISTSFPLYWFSAIEAKNHGLRSCFCGEGADELFGGYRTATPSEGYVMGKEVKNYIRINGTFSEEETKNLVGEKIEVENLQNRLNSEFKGEGKQNDLLFNRIRYLLTSGLIIDKHMLEKGDGMTMSKPVELRMPFLDKRSLDFAFNLPVDFCIENNNKKKIVKVLAKKINLPETIYNRPKQRTSLPYEYIYYHSKFGKQIKKLLISSDAKIKQIFPSKLIDEIVEKSEYNPKRIHALYILEVWLNKYM